MKNDVLLESFLEFELSDLDKSNVIGGWPTIGCGQNGSLSYADYSTSSGPMCNVLVSSNDGSGYMSSCEYQMQ